jgi:uncharacterized protein YbjT (DUF2867 family)
MTAAPATLYVAGATGLVGQALIARATTAPRIASVVCCVRRPIDIENAVAHVVDFGGPMTLPPATHGVAVCALGTTKRAAGSKEAFFAVDHDAVLHFAHAAKAAGVRTFVVVSSLGADGSSRNFYLQTKGKTEADLAAVGFSSLVVLRPSMLSGPRVESRPGETLALLASRVVFGVLGRAHKYAPVETDKVAAVALDAALLSTAGLHIIESDAIHARAHALAASRSAAPPSAA